MLSYEERLTVVDQATEENKVSVNKIRIILWHNWALSEAQVDVEIQNMYSEGLINEKRT